MITLIMIITDSTNGTTTTTNNNHNDNNNNDNNNDNINVLAVPKGEDGFVEDTRRSARVARSALLFLGLPGHRQGASFAILCYSIRHD